MVTWIRIIFPLFLNKMTVILAHKLAKIFCGLIAAGSFPALWRIANMKNLFLESFINLLIL